MLLFLLSIIALPRDPYKQKRNSVLLLTKQVQRQLQLRIEAQGKYLKKIIEEQQRLGGALAEEPSSVIPTPASAENFQESEDKTDPSTPGPTSESPIQTKVVQENVPNHPKSLTCNESSFSRHEPLTPDSGCRFGSPVESPKGQRWFDNLGPQITGPADRKPEMFLTHQILESSSNSSYQQPCSVFPDEGTFLSLGKEFNQGGGVEFSFVEGSPSCYLIFLLPHILSMSRAEGGWVHRDIVFHHHETSM
ncbi:hypothetical protein C5167_034086 [Papaver somniferum]|uniref:MYB-CC type transcription factor LHEQLE-containing domain-containing protein n=1 Tax=Papaver somniferum TaxID=3469 RepID=A0A4Y7KFJ2_PAPSO|nr:hypothetical protein C5167_034086 [Papaver somniferum]